MTTRFRIQISPCVLLLLALAAQLPAATRTNVRKFGATGNGNTDDSPALQRAIDHTPAGGTVVFPPGNYRVSQPLHFKSGRTYRGEPGALLRGEGGYFLAITEYDNTHDVTIDGLIFDGGGISLDGSNLPAFNVRISNCTFQNILTTSENWTVHNALFLPSGLVNGSIVNNVFRNILHGGEAKPGDTDAGGMAAWGLDHVTFADNHFDTVNQCVHVSFQQKWPSSHVVFARNTGVHIHRMGLEMQYANTAGLIVEDNRFSDFLNPYWNTFGISIATDGSQDNIVRNNTIIGLPAPQTPLKYGIGIEIGGIHTLVEGNIVQGFFVMGIGLGTAPRAVVRNNLACGSQGSMQIIAYLRPQPGAVFQGNVQGLDCHSLQFQRQPKLVSAN